MIPGSGGGPATGGANGDRGNDGGCPFGTGAPPCRGPVSALRGPRSASIGGNPPWLAFQTRPSGVRREPRATIWVSAVRASGSGFASSEASASAAAASSSDCRWTGAGIPCDGQNRARPRDWRAFSELDVGSMDLVLPSRCGTARTSRGTAVDGAPRAPGQVQRLSTVPSCAIRHTPCGSRVPGS